jgi:CHAT domain-containing protein
VARPAKETIDSVSRRDTRVLLSTADAFYARGEFDSARAGFQRVFDRAMESADTLTAARALTSIGLASWRRGNYADARTFGERAVALKISAGLTKELAKSYNALGLLAHNQGRFREAIDEFERAQTAAGDVRDSVWLAKARGNLGLVYSDIGDFPNARAGFDALRRLAAGHGDTTLEANALNNLGMVDIRAGNPRDALPLLVDALRLHRATDNAVGEENALGQLGTAYAAMGEPQIALSYLDSALTIARRHELRQQESDDLQLIAALYDELGDRTRALEFLGRAAPLADSLGMRKIQGDIARAQARTLIALGNSKGGRASAAAANRFHADAGATLEQLEDDLLVAELAQHDGDTRQSEKSLAAARALVATIDSRIARAELALGEARVAELGARPNDVLRALAAVHEDQSVVTTRNEWEAPALASRAYSKLGRLADAEAAGREAIRAVERVRGNLASGSLRTSFTSARAAVFADLVVTLLRRGKVAQALAIADAARSRALLEHLSAAARDSARRGSAADLVTAEQLLRRIDQLLERLRVADTSSPSPRTRLANDETGFLARQLAESRREYETLVRRASVADLRASALSGATLPNAAAIESSLLPGEVMLEYFVTSERLITFVVSSTEIRALERPLTDDALSSRVRLARDLLSRRGLTTAMHAPVLHELYQALVDPAAKAGLLRGAHTLMIVPHSVLAYLPFAALLDPESNRYLVERFDILVTPSAASFVGVRRRPPTTSDAIAAASVFAPFPRELPGTRAEAAAVERTAARSRAFVGPAATEQELRAALAEPRPVYVATHGVLNPRSPMFSRLELARPSKSGGPAPSADDGRLEVHELLDLTIRSPLVFLSGCETGAGAAWSTSFARGDDYATLAEAFLFAGARNVVSTLWRIEDKGAAVFAGAFYARVAERSPTEALARAQRAMLAEPEHSSPYYWAAYIVTGDGRPLPAQTRLGMSVK